jgi:CheY-like chemotaxis protein
MSQRASARLPIVLVVDDFVDGRELVTEYLTFRGFTVYSACDGAQALELANAVRPEVILLDLSMPGIDGWQTARTLKSDRRTTHIVVIAVTAHALAPEIDAARNAGCDGIICKPFDLAALGAALPRLLTQGMKALDVPGLSLTVPPFKPRQPRRRDHSES